MKRRIVVATLLVVALFLGYGNSASARGWGRGFYRPHVGVRIFAPIPQVIFPAPPVVVGVGGGYYGGGYYGGGYPAYGGGYYGHGGGYYGGRDGYYDHGGYGRGGGYAHGRGNYGPRGRR